MPPTEGTLAPLFMVLIACIFLVALDKTDAVIAHHKNASVIERIVIYLIMILILQILIVVLIAALYLA